MRCAKCPTGNCSSVTMWSQELTELYCFSHTQWKNHESGLVIHKYLSVCMTLTWLAALCWVMQMESVLWPLCFNCDILRRWFAFVLCRAWNNFDWVLRAHLVSKRVLVASAKVYVFELRELWMRDLFDTSSTLVCPNSHAVVSHEHLCCFLGGARTR